ncbi:MAG: class I SAM-dependent methyltransferase [Bacteroidetes bacterium]|nr:class I SAM-dependent methyltransferase [Bacteroidota bacterium]
MSQTLISQALLDALVPRLRCPQSGNALKLLVADALAQLNAQIAQGAVLRLDGTPWQAPLQLALAEEGGRYLYPVNDGLFFFLEDYTLLQPGQLPAHVTEKGLVGQQSQGVRGFYDQIGWEAKEGQFEDAHLFEDLRPVAAEYLARCHQRVNRYLPQEGGVFLLDAASGPVQYPEYLAYQEKFRWRICLDFSISALKQAQAKVGDRGVYMLADLTNLPFADNSLDAILSLHTIYHIPQEKQRTAFLEIYRALMPGKQGVVVYGWGSHHAIYKWAFLHKRIFWKLRSLLGIRPSRVRSSEDADKPTLYVHFHTWEWFRGQQWPFQLELFQWRALGPGITKLWIKPWFFGKAILRWVFRQEDKHPQKWAIKGAFPAFVIRKSA